MFGWIRPYFFLLSSIYGGNGFRGFRYRKFRPPSCRDGEFAHRDQPPSNFPDNVWAYGVVAPKFAFIMYLVVGGVWGGVVGSVGGKGAKL